MHAPRTTTGRTALAHGALVVDDDKFMLTVMADMLRDLGVVGIGTALNGGEGIAALDRMSVAPALILCDLNMPGNDGFQFMQQLANRSYAGGIVLVSGMDARIMRSATLMAKFHRLNILATLTKPVEAAALRAALDRLG
jgi:CheY-like chemotaxis protein